MTSPVAVAMDGTVCKRAALLGLFWERRDNALHVHLCVPFYAVRVSFRAVANGAYP